MSTLCFAILAHNNRDCLADQVENFHSLAPEARVVVFNGGNDPGLTSGLDVEVCPYSLPLRHEKVTYFHYHIMRWLYEGRRHCDFLIVLDSDMLLLKPGIAAYLERTMNNCGYMGTNFQEIVPGTPWDIGRRFRYHWQRGWQEIFAIHNPYGSFNPAQTFRWEYIERFVNYPKLPVLFERIAKTKLVSTEEIIYPTLAVTFDCAPRSNPGSHAMRLGRHSPQEIIAYLHDPDVFFIHKVGMTIDAPDRTLIRAITRGDHIDIASIDTTYMDMSARVKVPRYFFNWIKDSYYYCLREQI